MLFESVYEDERFRTSFRGLKWALGAVQFHSHKDNFIEQELLAHIIMYNAASAIARCADVKHKPDCKHGYRINFKMAVTVMRKYFNRTCKDPPDLMYRDVEKYIQPIRPGRHYPRRMRSQEPVFFNYRLA